MSADNQSYLEYVKQTASTPQYKWLVNFFRRENVGIKDDTTVTVLDSVKGKVKSTGAYRGITYDPEEIRSAITSSALNTTRIVVLTHGTYEKVNRDLVAIICWTYKLDPLFVMSHFYWDTEADDRRTNPKPKDTEGKKPSYQPISLPSLVNFLSLDDQGQFSCLMLTKLNPPTIIFFTAKRLWDNDNIDRPSNSGDISCDERPIELLRQLNESTLLQADANLIEYIHPYAEFFAAKFSREMSVIERGWEAKRKIELEADDDFENSWRPLYQAFSQLLPCLARSYHHLSQFVAKYPESQKLTILLHDYETIRKRATELERQMTLFFETEIAKKTWEEAMLSRRVGYLAFIFVPFSLAASIYGMNFVNVAETNIRDFLLVGFGLFLLFILLALIAHSRRCSRKWFKDQAVGWFIGKGLMKQWGKSKRKPGPFEP